MTTRARTRHTVSSWTKWARDVKTKLLITVFLSHSFFFYLSYVAESADHIKYHIDIFPLCTSTFSYSPHIYFFVFTVRRMCGRDGQRKYTYLFSFCFDETHIFVFLRLPNSGLVCVFASLFFALWPLLWLDGTISHRRPRPQFSISLSTVWCDGNFRYMRASNRTNNFTLIKYSENVYSINRLPSELALTLRPD